MFPHHQTTGVPYISCLHQGIISLLNRCLCTSEFRVLGSSLQVAKAGSIVLKHDCHEGSIWFLFLYFLLQLRSSSSMSSSTVAWQVYSSGPSKWCCSLSVNLSLNTRIEWHLQVTKQEAPVWLCASCSGKAGLVTHLKEEDEISVSLLQHIFVGGGYVLSLLC